MARHSYSNPKAIAYAKDWCGKEGNACGVFLNSENKSDCAHFLAHALASGGIVIKNLDPNTAFCPHGLAVRNTVLVDELKRLSNIFENIKPIELNDAIVGDIGFLKILKPTHAFMVCENWSQFGDPFSTPKVWAHSSARCCENMDTFWKQWITDAFRLEDG